MTFEDQLNKCLFPIQKEYAPFFPFLSKFDFF